MELHSVISSPVFHAPRTFTTHSQQTTKNEKIATEAVQRFLVLGKYAQKSSHYNLGRIRELKDYKLNSQKEVEKGVFFKQPKIQHLEEMLCKRERDLHIKPTIDYRFRSGDVILIEMYTSLTKKKVQKIVGLVLEVRKKPMHRASFIIRNTEKDGLVIYRQYPLHSPWIKSLKILKRYPVLCSVSLLWRRIDGGEFPPDTACWCCVC